MTDNREGKFTPWANGYYKKKSLASRIFLVEGETVTMQSLAGVPTDGGDDSSNKGSWTYGEFGEAHPTVVKEAGKKYNDVEITLWGGKWKQRGVLSDDGKKLFCLGMTQELDYYAWMTELELTALKESGDPADAPPSHHKVQPENQGKFLFISGAPGLGKSTSGHLLSKTAGYVYYEADSFMSHMNPYISEDAQEPAMAIRAQNFLKGVSQDRIDSVARGVKDFMAMIEGKEFDQRNLKGLYSALCKDITNERNRIGGDWVVVHAVPTRELRDYIRKELGPDLIFVVLNMAKGQQTERIKARHGDGNKALVDLLVNTYNVFEPATMDEENSIDLTITNDMSREDVVEKILEMVKYY